VSRESAAKLLLTRNAVRDIRTIYDYSKDRWGKKTAESYVDDIEAALERIKKRPELLRAEAQFHDALRFYRVNKHLLICDVRSNVIVLLSLLHTSMDIASQLSELQPTLAAEIEMLHRTLSRDQS